MAERPPVTEWATDSIIWIQGGSRPIRSGTRCGANARSRPPSLHGVYFPSRYDDVRAIAYDPEHFSSRRVVVRENPPPANNGAPPITSDPPRHRLARMVLLPPFTPQAIDKLVPKTRAICNELIDAIAGKPACDAAVDYAQQIPVKVIAHMLGVPASEGDRFRAGSRPSSRTASPRCALMAASSDPRYFAVHLDERRRAPGDDLISYLTQQTYPDGRQFTDNHVLGHGPASAGRRHRDTTWSGIGSCLWHLAKVPEDRRRLVQDPP